MTSIYDFYDKMGRNNIMLSFKGDITPELLTSILQITESKLQSIQEDPKIKKKVFNVLVECLQNLHHHLDEYPDNVNGTRYAIFLIGKDGENYSIMTGNYILNTKAAKLKVYLDKINSLSKEGLKELFKETLNNDKFNEKGGGGLGFIEISRKSNQPIDYDIKKIDDNYSFISFTVKIQ